MVPYVGIMLLLVHTQGLIGAAVAWALRVCIDSALLYILGLRLLQLPVRNLAWPAALVVGTAASLLLLLAPTPLWVRIGTAIIITAISTGIAWRTLLRESDRREVLTTLRLSTIASRL